MTIELSDELAEAALRAASKSGYKSTVEELLNSGVKASAMDGVAASIADFYGHSEIAAVLREAISKEKQASGGT
jgi:Arc/MetJ family transcription regulator